MVAPTRADSGLAGRPRTKAEVLDYLAPRVRGAQLLPQVYFTAAEWQLDRDGVLQRLAKQPWCHGGRLAVRSSTLREDGELESGAGRFASFLAVRWAHVAGAIDRVVASYEPAHPGDQILVQPHARGVRIAGVATSREPGSGRPYMVVNWCRGGNPRAITAGGSRRDQAWYWYRKAPRRPEQAELAAVIDLLREVEELLGLPDVDIEFVFAEDGLVLLQARPLAGLEPPAPRSSLDDELRRGERFLRDRLGPHPYLCGRTTCFSVMTDWNPAEMIGRRPRPLAASLYRDLITDRTWATQRADYGYRDVRGFPLLVTIAGQPFVDVRLSLNSFVPARLSDPIAHRLVDHWLDRLRARPSHHDKVEFEIVLSANSLDLPVRLRALREAGFTAPECEELDLCLRDLTNRMIAPDGPWERDRRRIRELPERRRAILDSQMATAAKIYWLLEDCRRFGTLAFAGMARVGFVAVQILRSMIATGLATPGDTDAFFAQLRTVSQVVSDFRSLPTEEFLRRHGHLRPGTYEILKATYEEAYQSYFAETSPAPPASAGGAPELLPDAARSRIDRALAERGFEIGAAELDVFLRAAIEGRESAKWEFTRSVSSILQLIEQLGREVGLSRDDCSFLTIADVARVYVSSEDAAAALGAGIEIERARHAASASAALPPLLFEAGEVWGFAAPEGEPTFLTRNLARGRVVCEPDGRSSVRGCIVLIRSADPGHDWLFCHDIAGLVTAYGGANSHMAIRAAELGVPAVIGAGEERLAEWAAARELEIDCANCEVRRLR